MIIELSKLRVDMEIYPRQNVDEVNISDIQRSMEAGHKMPPIVIAKGSHIIVDGVHRFHAGLRLKTKTISAQEKKYTNKAEMLRDAALLNSSTGQKLNTHDRLKVVANGIKFGLKEIDLAAMLRTSINYIHSLKPRFATVVNPGGKLEKIGLKNSTRHLSGEEITKEQGEAMERAPGQSYLLTCRQLLDAIRFKLLPPKEKHPRLWEELAALKTELESIV